MRPTAPHTATITVALLLCGALGLGCAHRSPGGVTGGAFPAVSGPRSPRAFTPFMDGRWIGNAVSYGPHRDGQAPGVVDPSRLELLEDLRIIARRWSLIRVYSTLGPTPEILGLIREERLSIRVMLGVWLTPEDRRDSTGAVAETFPSAVLANRAQVEGGIRLAREYEDIVITVCVGNETQVFWSAHRFPASQLIRDIRRLRGAVRQPVTTGDDFNFWNRPASRAVAAEVDFISMHAHPLWNGRLLGEALAWTVAQVESIRAFHPGRTVVLGETGWATRVHDDGEQARLIKGEAGEPGQRAFHRAATAWAESTRTTMFFFEVFDENWKGGSHPNEVEKHWGLFRADRTPKAAMKEEP